jgi:hypothetical protein
LEEAVVVLVEEVVETDSPQWAEAVEEEAPVDVVADVVADAVVEEEAPVEEVEDVAEVAPV